MEQLKTYLTNQKISFTEDDDIITINNKTFELIYPNEEGKLFNDDFVLITNPTDCDYFVFNFGGKYYYTPRGSESNPQLNELKYVGKVSSGILIDNFLGIRGAFELLNGSRLYKDWCKKAKFLETKVLGICEKNTLAGVLKFQMECKSNDIKSIIGATYTVKNLEDDTKFDIKCYVQNETGWMNLLSINKEVNVVNNGWIADKEFMKFTEGLIIVLDPKSIDFHKSFPFDLNPEQYYYQLDPVNYLNQSRSDWYLPNLFSFIKSDFKPVCITDAFYLDKEDNHIKQKLNTIGGFQEHLSNNQYFKDKEDYLNELLNLFDESSHDKVYDLFEKCMINEQEIVDNCNFQIDTSKRHLPKYKMTKEESEQFETNEDLFWHLIEKGLSEKITDIDIDKYIDRVQLEYDVIKEGDVLDYFLITRDIINWANNNDILVGIGRGSIGGTIIGYLLGIHHLNPFDYDLSFSRFLNRGRVKVSLPDCDSDFPSNRRNDVKNYMEQRFGLNQVCSVGTYTTMKIKGAIKDLARLESGCEFKDVNIVTSFIDNDCETITDLFRLAFKNKSVKNFIVDYSNVINDLALVLNQPKAKSIHACAMMIFPDEQDMYHWSPMKIQDGMIVSEFEGGELDSSGFLKEDILGILQLDKFKDIIDLIKENTGEKIIIYSIPLDDTEVYRYFCNGWNSDVFHFGSSDLTDYCYQLKPKNIHDLIAAIALYRPGAIKNNFHNEYILRKKGERGIKSYIGAEEILSTTYGIFVYQEQIIRMCQILGGMSEEEADNVRKALGKKKIDVLLKSKDQFINYYIENFDIDNEYAEQVWGEMEKASEYLFNRSHAAAYTITGYISQWLKVHYPTEYWTIAMKYAKEDDIANYISEINKTGAIKILPPDINISETFTKTDFKTKTIYWALSDIKSVGETSTEQIMKDRKENGEYFSISEFLSRHNFKGSKVNKRVIEHLILSGAFDGIEDIKQPKERIKLINHFREGKKIKLDSDLIELNQDKLNYNWWWSLQQKRLCGIAFFDFELLYQNYFEERERFKFMDTVSFNEEQSVKELVCIGGYVSDIEVKTSRKGQFARIVLEANYEFYNVIVWADQYRFLEDTLTDVKGKLILISGEVNLDKQKKMNVLYSTGETTVIIL